MLEDKEKNITIYLHTCLLEDKESIETYLYRRCEIKAKEIGTIEVLLKEKEVDKYLCQNSTIIKDKDLKDIIIDPCFRSDEEYIVNPFDKSYSRTCSFLEDCDYIKDNHLR